MNEQQLHAAALSRELDPTASHRSKEGSQIASVVAVNQDGHILIQRRRDSGKWCLPGGHAMAGEDPRVAAGRELKEETGLDAGYLDHLGTAKNGPLDIHVFRTSVGGQQPVTGKDPDNEADKFQWLDPASDVSQVAWHNDPDAALGFLGIKQTE